MELLTPIFAVGIFVGGFYVMVQTGRFVLTPVTRVVPLLNFPTKFRLSDLLWLMVLWQVVLAGILRLSGGRLHDNAGAVVLFGLALLVVTAIWVASISFLSRAGIHSPWRRAGFVLVLLPGTLATMLAAFACVMLVGSGLLDSTTNHETIAILVFGGLVAVVLTVAAMVALRRLGGWIVSGSEAFATSVDELPSGESFDRGRASECSVDRQP